jgi:hypothetical protein
MYLTISTSTKSGQRPTLVKWKTFDEAYTQFQRLIEPMNYKGKVPSHGEVREGLDYNDFYGFRVRDSRGSVMIFKS